MRRFITFTILISVFLDSMIFIRKPINLFLYYIFYFLFIVVFLIAYKSIKINKTFFSLLIAVAIISNVTALMSDINLFLVYKQLFAVGFSSLTFYLFIVYNNYDIQKIYKSYVYIAFWVGLIGIFQEFSYIIGFKYGYDYTYIFTYWTRYDTEFKYYMKVNSIVSEPSHFAIAMSPALFASIDRFFQENSFLSKGMASVIIVSYVLSGSALGMTSLILALMMVLYKNFYVDIKNAMKGKLVLYIAPFLIVVTIAGNFIYDLPFIKLRVNDSLKLITSKNPRALAEDLNLSTFSIYSNFLVAKESFSKNPLFGSGLGTHSANYDRYIGQYFSRDLYGVKNAMNKEDGSTLFIRLLSETGIFGLLILFLFLKRNYIKNQLYSGIDHNLWLINKSILLFFLLKIFRHGNYSLLGFFLFAFLYYLSYKQFTNRNIPIKETVAA